MLFGSEILNLTQISLIMHNLLEMGGIAFEERNNYYDCLLESIIPTILENLCEFQWDCSAQQATQGIEHQGLVVSFKKLKKKERNSDAPVNEIEFPN